MSDRYDAKAVRDAWQRLLWRASETKRQPTAESDRLALWSVSVVDPAGERILLDVLARAWSQGWQPAEVLHVVAHKTDRVAARLVGVAIVADHDRRGSQAIDPRWQVQIDRLDARQESTRHDWLRQWRRREGMDRRRCYDAVGAAWRVLSRLPHLPLLIPAPGVDPSAVMVGAPALATTADPVLDRIRKLLAKAESTDFGAEAELLTAKAQELMARHAVDRARVERGAAGDEPCMTRVLLESPYVVVKGALLAAVADANRCRAIGITGLNLSVVVGHAEDLAAVEVLFTSLLVQASHALAALARPAAAGDRSRTSAFRRSFHLGFASRIGERLATENKAVLAEAGALPSLPVLRSRERAVDDTVQSLFGGRLTESRIGGRYDAWGAAQGRSAADLARLNAGELSA